MYLSKRVNSRWLLLLDNKNKNETTVGIRRSLNKQRRGIGNAEKEFPRIMLKPGSGRKPEHPVWNYFQYDSDRNVSVCMVDDCMAEIKGKNATNVMNHLRRKHAEVAETLPTAAERLNKSIESRSLSGSQSTTPTEIKPIKREWDHESRVDPYHYIQISKYLGKHMLPSSHVDDGSFREMFAAFRVQGCELPGREMIYSTLCSLAESTTRNIMSDLDDARRLVITMDCWSQTDRTSTHVAISASMYSLLCDAPIHILLDVSEIPLPITKDVLTTKLEACVERWGIDTNKLVLIRMENSCNFIRAINSFIEFPEHEDVIVKEVDVPLIEYKGIRVEHCLTLILQSVIRDILKKPLISNILEPFRSYVNSGTLQINREKEKTLPTEWRSTLRFIEDSLTGKKDDPWKFCSNNNGKCDWGKLQTLKNVLDPIKDLIDLLERESLPLSNVIPSLLEIFVILRKLPFSEKNSLELDLSIKKRFSHIFDVKDPNFDPLPAVTSFLDPTVSCFMHRSEVQDLLDAAIKHIRLSVNNVSQQTRCEVVQQVRKPSKLFKMLREDTAENVVFRSGILGEDALLEKELENYMKIVPNYEDESGMLFWCQNAYLYPLLAPFAQDLLAIPASQKYEERAFTVYLHLNRRKWMYSEEDLIMRTFLKANSIFYAD